MATKQKPYSDVVKALLEERKGIALHDLAMRKVDEVLTATSLEAMPIDVEINSEGIEGRLKQYESIIGDLETLIILASYWSDGEHQLTLQKILARLTENEQVEESGSFWLRLRGYPFARIVYAGGLAAVGGERYRNLSTLVRSWTGFNIHNEDVIAVARLRKTFSSLHDPIQNHPQFAKHRYYTPVSDYLFSSLQPTLGKLFLVDKHYESFFDRFELLVGLLHSDMVKRQGAFYGRFVWKYRRLVPDSPTNPLIALQKEAEQQLSNWPMFQAGLFGGSLDRFVNACTNMHRQIEATNWLR